MVVVGRQGAATDDDGYNNITLLMTTSNKKRQQATLWQIVHFVCGLEGQVEKRSRVLARESPKAPTFLMRPFICPARTT